MKHQQYREWALEEASLLPEQQREMRQHLQSCTECQQWQQALGQVESLFQSASSRSAPAGFANRFKANLAAEKAGRQRRLAWLVLTLTMGGSLATVGLMGYTTLTNLPLVLGELLKGFLSFSAQVAVLSKIAQGFVALLPTPAADLMGLSLLIALSGLALALFAGLGGLWAAAVFRFVYPTTRTGGSK